MICLSYEEFNELLKKIISIILKPFEETIDIEFSKHLTNRQKFLMTHGKHRIKKKWYNKAKKNIIKELCK